MAKTTKAAKPRKAPLAKPKPKPKPKGKPRAGAYERVKARSRAASAARVAAGQEIGPIPPVADPERRAAAVENLRVFCETYFPETFNLAWSRDHLRVIAKIERVTRGHETMAMAMPRGGGKSTLCETAVQWAILGGWHEFVMLIAATKEDAEDALESIKTTLLGNALLREVFPEALFPIHKLDGEPRKCKGQRCNGLLTGILWGSSRVILPTIPGGPSSGAVIRTSGITGHIRGAHHVRKGGRRVRPTLVICDDPQTEESAKSAIQSTDRLNILNNAVRGLAGPGNTTAIIVPCTLIFPGDLSDQLLNPNDNPAWQGERTRMVNTWPVNTKLWEEYRKLRDARKRGEGRAGEQAETDFYRRHRAMCGLSLADERHCKQCGHAETCMDCGATVSWAERLGDEGAISALQNAMNIRYDVGDPGFWTNYQNEAWVDSGSPVLTAAQCAERYNGRPRGQVPIPCTELAMFIDLQQALLYYCVCGWEPNFTGYVVDYGTWPAQTTPDFSLAEVARGGRSLGLRYPGRGVEATIQAGLEELVATSLAREWPKAGGAGVMRISRLLVDIGRWPGIPAAVKHRCGGATMTLYRGIGIKAGNKPISAYKRKPGERYGAHWYMPAVRGTGDFPYLASDVNYWKSFVHTALQTAPGDPGALTLFGESAREHGNFARHVTAEYWTATYGHGRAVQEWKIKPGSPDNHWLDCLTGCACAASLQGIQSPGEQEAQRRTSPSRARLRPLAEVGR